MRRGLESLLILGLAVVILPLAGAPPPAVRGWKVGSEFQNPWPEGLEKEFQSRAGRIVA